MHLRFDPVIDLGARKPPLTADLMAGDVTAVGHLIYLAHVALEVTGHLLQIHHLARHCPFLTNRLGPHLYYRQLLRPAWSAKTSRPGTTLPFSQLNGTIRAGGRSVSTRTGSIPASAGRRAVSIPFRLQMPRRTRDEMIAHARAD